MNATEYCLQYSKVKPCNAWAGVATAAEILRIFTFKELIPRINTLYKTEGRSSRWAEFMEK